MQYSVQSVLYTVYNAVKCSGVLYTVYGAVKCTKFTIHCIKFSTVHNVYCTLYMVQLSVQSVLYTVYGAVQDTMCTVHCI